MKKTNTNVMVFVGVFFVGVCLLVYSIKHTIEEGYVSGSFESSLLFASGFWTLIGSAVIINNIINIINNIYKEKSRKKLLSTGKVIYATVDYIDVEYGANNEIRYFICCTYKNSYENTVYHFLSDALTEDPRELYDKGSSINVVVDPDNYKRYYVKASLSKEKKIIDYQNVDSINSIYIFFLIVGILFFSVSMIMFLYNDPNTTSIAVLFGIISLFAIFVGIKPLILLFGKIGKRNRLDRKGQAIDARIESVQLDSSYMVNHKNPFVIYCTYEDRFEDVIYRFRSGHLWEDPSGYCEIGSDIKVVVNPDNYKEYYVDVEGKKSESIRHFT